MKPLTISKILEVGKSDRVAITAPQRVPLSYSELRLHCKKIGRQLASQGLSNQSRVAIVMPNGPEMATAFLAVASYMSAAPLNPSYKKSEYEFYLKDLKPKLVIVAENSENPVIEAAEQFSIPVVEAKTWEGASAGVFELFEGEGNLNPSTSDMEALVLHTSGTTSRPKIVPLLQSNVAASVQNIASSIELVPNDHCLNIMPLFHIHGLIAVLTTSVSMGASVCCLPGFNAISFLDKAAEEKISWFSGVPTMHQALLLRAKRNIEKCRGLKLRLIRSSSASLPPAVFEELNEIFGCPIVEAYGMTEATHQMTSNPLGTNMQKAGSVGIITSPSVCIMDQHGDQKQRGEEGEVCIKGDNVTLGYENNPEANLTSFTDGWFRTGDQGLIDKDGYLKITGRLKEIINRGGEKISPLEVDNVLMDHPAIQQVVTFSVNDKMLGEEIGAAIILQNNAELNKEELLEYASEKLAKFKIPKHICFVDEIPKGSTGKLQRIGLAKKLGLEN